MFEDLKGRVCIVTGGTRGIGRGIVESLSDVGAKVVFTYKNNHQQAQDIIESLNRENNNIWAFPSHITDGESSVALINQIEDEIGPIYALINNAGITADKSFLTMPEDNWHSVLTTNLDGVFHLTQAALLKMIHRQEGKVIMMSSVSGLQASPGQANYSASKAALVGLTKTLSHEVARFNIQVNAVAPGFIETEMVSQMAEKVKAKIPKLIPSRRMGQVEEVAKPVLFLLSNGANYVTGHTLVIDGGLSS